MESKMTWNEIEQNYDQEWVQLIDYEWDETEPYPQCGVVRCHSKSRKELSQRVRENPVNDSAILFVGAWNIPEHSVLNFNKHRLVVSPKQ